MKNKTNCCETSKHIFILFITVLLKFVINPHIRLKTGILFNWNVDICIIYLETVTIKPIDIILRTKRTCAVIMRSKLEKTPTFSF